MWKNALEGRRILVVEDDVNNRELLVDVFDGSGCQLDIAEGSDGAIELRKRQTYDLVLMDLHMPTKSGFDCTLEMRMLEKTNSQRRGLILALTADTLTSTLEKCMKVGMDGYITKPINIVNFRKTIIEKLSLSSRG